MGSIGDLETQVEKYRHTLEEANGNLEVRSDDKSKNDGVKPQTENVLVANFPNNPKVVINRLLVHANTAKHIVLLPHQNRKQ
jgi:hypothetical protein